MTTEIKAPFATARKTAATLGVSKSRLKALERLAHVKLTAKRKSKARAGKAHSGAKV